MDTQSLAKLPFNLKILPTDENGIPNGVPFIAMFNPESFTISETIDWNSDVKAGGDGTDPPFLKVNPRTFTMDFMLDGTGVNTNGVKIPVTAQVVLFRLATTTLNGSTHRPPYMLVQYGTFICFCILNSTSVNYTMFDMFGLPIRAKISASFTERKLGTLSAILGMLSSPDLTHQVQAKQYDLLPLLTYRVYNNQDYYLQVAKLNRIKNFRRPCTGTETYFFPPIAKK